MSEQTLELLFDDLTGYGIYPEHLETNGTYALLKKIDNPTLSFEELFGDDTGFTYNSNLAEFLDGILKTKNHTPPNASSFATFTTNKDLNFGGGNKTSTLHGAAVVESGELKLLGGVSAYCDFEATGNADSQQSLAFKFRMKPNYTGGAAPEQDIVLVCRSNNDPRNLIRLRHRGTSMHLYLYDKDGVLLSSSAFGNWNAVAGTTYEVELNIDLTLGESRLFIEEKEFGVCEQIGSMITTIGLRDSNIGLLRFGASYTGGEVSNMTIEDFVGFDNVQHTSNYQSGYTLPEAAYLGSKIDGPAFVYSGPGEIVSLDNAVTTETGTPRFILNGLYWNGAAWVVSDGSYAQSNPIAIAVANFGTFPTSGLTTLPWSIVFEDSDTESSVDLFTVQYTGQKYADSRPFIYRLAGTYLDGITSITAVKSEPPLTVLKYALMADNTAYYYNGSAWVQAYGVPGHCNTEEEVNENLSSFDFKNGITFHLMTFFETTDINATPTLTSIAIVYDFDIPPIYPATCIVYGTVTNMSGEPVEGAIVKFSSDDFYHGNNLVTIDTTVVTGQDGQFDVSIVETETLGIPVKVEFSYKENKKTKTTTFSGKIIPNITSVEVSSLADA